MEVIQIRPLTERETEILNLLAKFKENSEIARELNVSESTVKAHIMSILNKLGTYSRSQAVIVALKNGLIKLDDIQVKKRGQTIL